MIIDKSTSDPILVNALVALNNTGEPLKNITLFNTETCEATISGGETETAKTFRFVVDSEEDCIALVDIIDEVYPPEEPGEHGMVYPHPQNPARLVSVKTKFKGKKGMHDADTLPDHHLVLVTSVKLITVKCSNCSKVFLIYVGANNSVWSANFVNEVATFQMLTEVDTDALTCDNCEEAVSIYDPT